MWSWDFHTEAYNWLDNPGAIQEALELLELLGGIGPTKGGAYVIKWWSNADTMFSVKSCISFLREYQLEEAVEKNNL